MAVEMPLFQALRRLQQAGEVHAKRLARFGGLTPVQLMVLQVLATETRMTATFRNDSADVLEGDFSFDMPAGSVITEVFGGEVVRAGRLMHGKVSPVNHDGKGVFAGAPQPLQVGRYHSLIARPESLPPVLEVTARTPEGEIMGVRHKELMVEGVQFHPESVLTEHGHAMLKNFLS